MGGVRIPAGQRTLVAHLRGQLSTRDGRDDGKGRDDAVEAAKDDALDAA